MKRCVCRIAITALAAAMPLSGCTSAPTHYYTLSPTIPPALPATGSDFARSVIVSAVSIPDLVDRMQLVVRRSPTQVDIVETRQWAQPLRDQIPDILVHDLRAGLGTTNIASDTRLVSGMPLKASIRIEQFDGTPGGNVIVHARWSIIGGSGPAPLIGEFTSMQPVIGNDFDAVVESWGKALTEISNALAASLRLADAK